MSYGWNSKWLYCAIYVFFFTFAQPWAENMISRLCLFTYHFVYFFFFRYFQIRSIFTRQQSVVLAYQFTVANYFIYEKIQIKTKQDKMNISYMYTYLLMYLVHYISTFHINKYLFIFSFHTLYMNLIQTKQMENIKNI